METAAANLTDGKPCRAFEQPPEVAQMLGVDLVYTACFEPASFFMKDGQPVGRRAGHELQSRRRAQDRRARIAHVLSNDMTGVVPLAEHIGIARKP